MPARAQIATEEYQLPHYAATDIPNHSRRRNGSSESLTEKGSITFGMVRCTEPFIVSGWGEGIRVAFPDRTGSERHRTIRRP